MTKRVAISQSNYIPWKGYFDLINTVDEFILLDDVQYTRRDWRNRNRIKTPQGPKWLSVPVEVKGKYDQRIDETMIADPSWPASHFGSLLQNYRDAPFWSTYGDELRALYDASGAERLSDVNRRFIEAICRWLEIDTPISWSTDHAAETGANERLLALCKAVGATEYISGPAARSYLDEQLFADAGVAVAWMDYGGYPEYEQPHPPFEHAVTVLDLLLSTGPEARRYMKSFVVSGLEA